MNNKKILKKKKNKFQKIINFKYFIDDITD